MKVVQKEVGPLKNGHAHLVGQAVNGSSQFGLHEAAMGGEQAERRRNASP